METISAPPSSEGYIRDYKYKGDSQEVRLLVDLIQRRHEKDFFNSMEIQLEFHRLFAKAIGNLNIFVKQNLVSRATIPSRLLDLLVDSHRFLNTGQRDVSIANWGSLVEVSDWIALTDKHNDLIKTLRFPKFEDMIIKWCTLDNGFYDLVLVTEILVLETYRSTNPETLNATAPSVNF